MQNNRFVVLTGHLSNYSLSDLIGILRHQKKTGRLLIEYPKGPATLFFENGELIDARLNELTGLQAVCVLLSQPDASFNFNPLIRSSQRSIEQSMQRVVSELFGCWDESAVQIEAEPPTKPLELKSEASPVIPALSGRQTELLALPPAPSFSTRQKSIYVIAAAVLIVIGISTVIALTANRNSREFDSASLTDRSSTAVSGDPATTNKPKGIETRGSDGARNRASSSAERRELKATSKRSAESEQANAQSSETNAPDSTASKPQAIKVVMQIENGRVLNASIANHSAGMDSFEALALRIARQRRYAADKNGAETVTISVNK